MSHHTIRVVLLFGEERQYQQLSQSLRAVGIQSTIRQKDGRTYKLPAGEYYFFSELSCDLIREKVFEIASQIGQAAVLVTAARSIAWVGLEEHLK